MFRSSCLWFLLICSIAICYGDSEDDEEAICSLFVPEIRVFLADPASPNRTEVDFALARTLNIIARKTERGRLALLLCNVHCPKDKRMVPEWVRKFNDQQGYTFSERVAYHYYFLKHHLPLLNETGPITEPTIVFLIGKEVFVYPGVISDQESLLKWLEELDQDDVIIPKTHEELDMYLNTQNCSDKYLIYSAHDKCQIPQWRSIARIVRLKMQIKTIYIRRPIADHQMSTVLFKRLPLMNEQDCMFMTFVQLRSYSYPLTIGTPAQMAEHLSLLTTDNECVMLDDGFSLPISAPLSDLEMEYFTGERRLFHLEQSTAYVIVGATSGVAVIALAISIFWGLNGTAFAA